MMDLYSGEKGGQYRRLPLESLGNREDLIIGRGGVALRFFGGEDRGRIGIGSLQRGWYEEAG